MSLQSLPEITISNTAMSILKAAEARNELTLASTVDELVELSVPSDKVDDSGYFTVGYDIPGKGYVPEVKVCRVRNGAGVAANYFDPAMRRRDPDCMVIADGTRTDKTTWKDRFGGDFSQTRAETIEWLKTQPIACFFFRTGLPDEPINAIAIAPANAGFFALGLAMLQGIIPIDEVRATGADYNHEAVIYVAPPFRHTHFEGRQVVVHNRRLEETPSLHELFSYNLYPGPSAKKGVYGMLLTAGEQDEKPWTTAHCSTVQVVTPYDQTTTIMHEGASGGGKSEMLEHIHRQPNGQLKLGKNLVTDDERFITVPQGCSLHPVTDDMALCHNSLQATEGREQKLSLVDAEAAWFVRVNHITAYGTDPVLEKLSIHPPGPILFLNIKARPGGTSLIWEHVEDAPGKPCPNPRLILPRKYVENVVHQKVTVDIRSFGVRCPPCTKERPTYGIMGLFHVLDPALAWLWRLVAPRGHGNPSIVDRAGMQSEGVGSYWPFATGRKVDQANILLRQIIDTPDTRFILIPNQHIGSWEVGFSGQWLAREYLSRRGLAPFAEDAMVDSRCPLLGKHLRKIQVEGQTIGTWFFDVSSQPEVGLDAYDQGAEILTEFFHSQIRQFLHDDLDPRGRDIIEACLANDLAATRDLALA